MCFCTLQISSFFYGTYWHSGPSYKLCDLWEIYDFSITLSIDQIISRRKRIILVNFTDLLDEDLGLTWLFIVFLKKSGYVLLYLSNCWWMCYSYHLNITQTIKFDHIKLRQFVIWFVFLHLGNIVGEHSIHVF